MPVRLTPEEFATKHARRLQAALPDVRAGIERVTVSPTSQAAAKQDKMLQNLTRAVTDGKWRRGLERVTLEDWKSAAINKGVPRIAAGIDAAHGKQVEFATKLFAHLNPLMTKIHAMPDLTIEDSIARSTAMIRGMAEFKR